MTRASGASAAELTSVPWFSLSRPFPFQRCGAPGPTGCELVMAPPWGQGSIGAVREGPKHSPFGGVVLG